MIADAKAALHQLLQTPAQNLDVAKVVAAIEKYTDYGAVLQHELQELEIIRSRIGEQCQQKLGAIIAARVQMQQEHVDGAVLAVATELTPRGERSARGELPQIAWDQELKSVASELPPTDRASFAATRELRKALLRRIPHDSHELRLREALRSVAEGAPDEHAALFPLKGAGRDARDALRRLAELQFEPFEPAESVL